MRLVGIEGAHRRRRGKPRRAALSTARAPELVRRSSPPRQPTDYGWRTFPTCPWEVSLPCCGRRRVLRHLEDRTGLHPCMAVTSRAGDGGVLLHRRHLQPRRRHSRLGNLSPATYEKNHHESLTHMRCPAHRGHFRPEPSPACADGGQQRFGTGCRSVHGKRQPRTDRTVGCPSQTDSHRRARGLPSWPPSSREQTTCRRYSLW